MSADGGGRRRLARIVRRFAIPIILFWVAITALLNLAVPQLEVVGREHAVALSTKDAPSTQAMKRIGKTFHEYTSDNVAMLVLEGEKPLAADAHRYYNDVIKELSRDKKDVQHVQDLWGDPATAAGVQSRDGKAAYVQLNLAGNQGGTAANEALAGVRKVVARIPPPNGVKAYVTGSGALSADLLDAGDKSMIMMTTISIVVIAIMMFIVYRSLSTVLILLALMGIGVGAARGLVALLADQNVLGLTFFATNLLTTLAIAAGTDYGIFFIGRYQEARQAGEDRETAYYTTFRSVSPIVLGSGLTIAGAISCLSLTRLNYFNSLGIPAGIGLAVAVLVALTLAPAVLSVASRRGLLDAKRTISTRRWRRIGTAVVRWPGAVLAAALAVSLVGLLVLPSYKTSYDDRHYIPTSTPADQGIQAADRHFAVGRLNPDMLLVQTDHDMRNPTDMLVLDRIAKRIIRVAGIARVQGITRPLGAPIEHSSLAFQISAQSSSMVENLGYLKDRLADMLKMADDLGGMISTVERMQVLMQQLSGTTHRMVGEMAELKNTTDQIRDHIADFDDFARPLRRYLYTERHCYDIPVCWAVRSAFDATDGVDELSENLHKFLADARDFDKIMPQTVALLPPMITTMRDLRALLLILHSTLSGLVAQLQAMSDNAAAMGKAFDGAKNDDTFYLPPDVFSNSDFQKGLKLYLSPDGTAARYIITQKGDPATPKGIARVGPIKRAAQDAVKQSPLAAADIYLAGTASTYKDMQDGAKYDLMIAVLAALGLITAIMLTLTRSLVAALVIMGTVALSLGASFGLSVLIWQHLLGLELHWLVLAFTLIVLLAVGSDYNLLLVSRFEEEIGAGIKTGIIRSMGSTGGVVTAAGLVFAFTLGSMASSDVRVVGQIGTSIAIGLLFDTLVVRSFLMPSIAALLGRWFWWPQIVRSRPASQLLRPFGPRAAVRSLLLPNAERAAAAHTADGQTS